MKLTRRNFDRVSFFLHVNRGDKSRRIFSSGKRNKVKSIGFVFLKGRSPSSLFKTQYYFAQFPVTCVAYKTIETVVQVCSRFPHCARRSGVWCGVCVCVCGGGGGGGGGGNSNDARPC